MTNRALWITPGIGFLLILVLQGCGGSATVTPTADTPPGQSDVPSESEPTAPEGYREITVANGGSISGTVTFNGTTPPQGTITVDKHNEIFGDTLVDETLLVSAEGGIQNVAVFIEEIMEGKPIGDALPLLINKAGLFVPRVQVFAQGEWILRNEDPVLHNIHPYLGIKGEGGLSLYNIALSPGEGGAAKETTQRLRRGLGLHQIRCDSHKWMVSWAWVLDHPYGAVTDAAGAFQISDIPAGNYRFKVWHETLGEQVVDVTVKAGEVTEVSFDFDL